MSARGERLTFKARVRVALADPLLKVAIDRTTGNARAKRAAAMAAARSNAAR